MHTLVGVLAPHILRSHPHHTPTALHAEPNDTSKDSHGPETTRIVPLHKRLDALHCAVQHCAEHHWGLTHGNLAPALRQQRLCTCRPCNPDSCRLLPAHSCKSDVVCNMIEFKRHPTGFPPHQQSVHTQTLSQHAKPTSACRIPRHPRLQRAVGTSLQRPCAQ
jgi:hypothetical protein